MHIVSLLFLVSAILVSFLSCIYDFRIMKIPNWQAGLIAALFLPAFLLSPESFYPWWHHLGAAAFMFIVGYLLFVMKVMGGGDSKFITAVSLWVGFKGMMLLVLVMAITGGILGICTILMRKYKPFKISLQESWIYKAQAGKNGVPYGIAISCGFWVSIFHTLPLINHLLTNNINLIN